MDTKNICLLYLSRSLGPGEVRIRHLAISAGYFESLPIYELLDFPDDDTVDGSPKCGRLLGLFAEFSNLKTLNIVIGTPAYQRELACKTGDELAYWNHKASPEFY
jgi:hypothetical protein